MKKKSLCLASILCALSLSICGCSKADDGKVVVRFFGWGSQAEQRNFQIMINKFMEINPDIRVAYEAQVASTYMTALEQRIKSLPDVFYMPDYEFVKWAKNDKLLDLSPYISQEEKNDVWSIVYDMYRFDRSTNTLGEGTAIYGLGKDLGPYTLVYNKTMLEKYAREAGKEPTYPSNTTPMTYGEFVDFLLEFKSNVEASGVESTGKNGLFGIGFYELMHAVYSNNSDFWSEDTKTSLITTPNFVEAVQWIADLDLVHHVAPDYITAKSMSGFERFENSKCLMTFMGPWDMATFWNDIKDKFEYDIIPTPVGPAEGAKSTSWMGSVALSLKKNFKDEKVKEASIKLAKFLTLDPITCELNYTLGQAQPNNIETATTKWVNNENLEGYYQYPKSKNVWIDVTMETENIKHHNRSRYFLYDNAPYDDLLKEITAKVYTGMMSAKDCLEGYEETYQAALDVNATYFA